MGQVIDFLKYKNEKEMSLKKPCKLPWHKDKYVKNGRCRRCNLFVVLIDHPSFKKPRYKG